MEISRECDGKKRIVIKLESGVRVIKVCRGCAKCRKG